MMRTEDAPFGRRDPAVIRKCVSPPRAGRASRTCRRDRELASQSHPSPSRRPPVRWQKTLSTGLRRARRVGRLPPDSRGPRVSWQHRAARGLATSPVPRSAPPSNAPPEPRGRRTDGQLPPVLELPRVLLPAVRAPPTPARHPRRHRAVVGPECREALPDERGLRRPGHDQIPSRDPVFQQRAATRRIHLTGLSAASRPRCRRQERSMPGCRVPALQGHVGSVRWSPRLKGTSKSAVVHPWLPQRDRPPQWHQPLWATSPVSGRGRGRHDPHRATPGADGSNSCPRDLIDRPGARVSGG